MKTINVTFTDEEYIVLLGFKKDKSWHDFILKEVDNNADRTAKSVWTNQKPTAGDSHTQKKSDCIVFWGLWTEEYGSEQRRCQVWFRITSI